MSYLDEAALSELFERLRQAAIGEHDQADYTELATDDERLIWLKDLATTLHGAVDDKERAITDLESEIDDLRAVGTALEAVAQRVRLRLGIETVAGQLPLLTTATGTTATGD